MRIPVGILVSGKTHIKYKQTKFFGNYSDRGKKGFGEQKKNICNIKLNKTILVGVSNGIQGKTQRFEVSKAGLLKSPSMQVIIGLHLTVLRITSTCIYI